MSRNRLRKATVAAVAVAGMTAAGLVATQAPAHADAGGSCSAGGFTGYIAVIGSHSNVSDVRYQIQKGGNTGGNHANVDFIDYGTMPARHLSTGDNGIQDGRNHSLGGGYARGSGSVYAQFIFDKSGAADPRCSFGINL